MQCRKQLAEVEARRGQFEQNVPPALWQEFADISRALELAERQLCKACEELSLELNQTRLRIVAWLNQYNRMREQMRQVEEFFLVNILRPGYRLKEAIHQSQWLEEEYRRIQKRISRAGYSNLEELEADIHSVLAQAAAASELEPETQDQENIRENEPMVSLQDIRVEEVVDALAYEILAWEFKRVVLPRVHPDTSDCQEEVFKTVYEVYKRADALLMEAYIVQYRGEIKAEEKKDPLEELDRLLDAKQQLERLAARLQHRLEQLKQDQTSQEEHDPGRLRENIREQRQEILSRIQVEAEHILAWREKIAGLVQEYQDLNRQV